MLDAADVDVVDSADAVVDATAAVVDATAAVVADLFDTVVTSVSAVTTIPDY